MSERRACPVCGRVTDTGFFRMASVPVRQNAVIPTRADALACPRGVIELRFCEGCGMVWNAAFDSALVEYAADYDNTQMCSDVFSRYVQHLADELVERGLRDRDILEIGCGQGDFLRMVVARGNNRGTGFDPAFTGDLDPSPSLHFVRDYYSVRHSDSAADAVIARHTLEHVPSPADIVAAGVASLSGRPPSSVFIEVPSVEWILRHHVFWDVFYEHCSYYSKPALERLLAGAGLHVEGVEPAFGDQYFWAEGTLRSEPAAEPRTRDAPTQLGALARQFAPGVSARLAAMRELLGVDARRAVVWGAAAKGVSFLNALDVTYERLPYVVDINPRKQGHFVAGTGQMIIAPEELTEYKPDIVVVMNPLYRDEIAATLRALGLPSEVVTV